MCPQDSPSPFRCCIRQDHRRRDLSGQAQTETPDRRAHPSGSWAEANCCGRAEWMRSMTALQPGPHGHTPRTTVLDTLPPMQRDSGSEPWGICLKASLQKSFT